MAKYIFISAEKQIPGEFQNNNTLIVSASNTGEILKKIVANGHTFAIIIDLENYSLELANVLTEKITRLNSLIIILYYFHNHQTLKQIKQTDLKYPAFSNFEEISAHLNACQGNRRTANRTNWQVKVKFYDSKTPEDYHWGFITSLSTSGCFIKTSDQEFFKNKTNIVLLITFEDFSFLVEAILIRQEQTERMLGGFACKFEGISNATLRAIESIINEKIFNELETNYDPRMGK